MNTQHLPLEQLILSLLALAEAAPHLSESELAFLQKQSEELERKLAQLESPADPMSVVKILNRTGRRLYFKLSAQQPAFKEAKEAWDQQMTVRVGLGLKEINNTFVNPSPPPATGTVTPSEPPPPEEEEETRGLAHFTAIVKAAVKNPIAFAKRSEELRKLASLIRK